MYCVYELHNNNNNTFKLTQADLVACVHIILYHHSWIQDCSDCLAKQSHRKFMGLHIPKIF